MPDRRQCGGPHPAPDRLGRLAPPRWSGFTPPKWYSFAPPLTPSLGFIHTGKMLSFVYDVADLYKTETAMPAAFRTVAKGETGNIESAVRRTCRDYFHQTRLLSRIVSDIGHVLNVATDKETDNPVDADAALPGGIWDLEDGFVQGGVNYSESVEVSIGDHITGTSFAELEG